jgi:hypothetical protein
MRIRATLKRLNKPASKDYMTNWEIVFAIMTTIILAEVGVASVMVLKLVIG